MAQDGHPRQDWVQARAVQYVPSYPSIVCKTAVLTREDRVLASFVKTQGLAAPSAAETEEYCIFSRRKGLSRSGTRFLNFPDDLVALRSPSLSYCLSSGARTPMPVVDTLSPCTFETETEQSKPEAHLPPRRHDLSAPSLAAAMAISVVLPFLSFTSITRFPTARR